MGQSRTFRTILEDKYIQGVRQDIFQEIMDELSAPTSTTSTKPILHLNLTTLYTKIQPTTFKGPTHSYKKYYQPLSSPSGREAKAKSDLRQRSNHGYQAWSGTVTADRKNVQTRIPKECPKNEEPPINLTPDQKKTLFQLQQLGINFPESVTAKEIKRIYHQSLLQRHPDRLMANKGIDMNKATKEFQDLLHLWRQFEVQAKCK